MSKIKLIERVSQKGTKYLQTAINNFENKGETLFIPVFKKKGIQDFQFESKERKTDSRGEVYTLYEVLSKNVFLPTLIWDEELNCYFSYEGNDFEVTAHRAILMK